MSSLLFKLLVGKGGGGGGALLADPIVAMLGDSITQFGSNAVGLSGATMTRDSSGVVTVAKTNHAIYGTPTCYIINCPDVSYEAIGPITNITANSFSYQTSVTGSAGNIVGTSNTAAVVWNRHTMDGTWLWMQSLFGGGLRFAGNFGQGGDRADEMTAAGALCAATNADFVVLEAGINDIKQSVSGATIISRVQTLVDQQTAVGKKVVVVSVEPLGSVSATNAFNTETLAANVGLAAMANGVNVFYANTHQDLVDTGATQFTTGRSWSWVQPDGTHPSERAARLKAIRVQEAMAAKVAVVNCLPTASGNLPTIPGFTAIFEYGAWSATGGGFNGTGSSGTVQPKCQVFSNNAASTIANSLVDRGDATKGYFQRQVITPGGSHTITNHFLTNSGTSLAALGLTSSDTVMFAVEVGISGAIAGNVIAIKAALQSNSSGAFGIATAGDYIGKSNSTYRNDALTNDLLLTGELKLNASITALLGLLEIRHLVAGIPYTVDIGRVVLFKKTP